MASLKTSWKKFHKYFEAKRRKCLGLLKNVARLFNDFGFTVEMLKGSLRENRKVQ